MAKNNTKRCSTFIVIGKMQIKIKISFYTELIDNQFFGQIHNKNLKVWTMPYFGDMDQKEFLHIAVKNKNWYSNFKK